MPSPPNRTSSAEGTGPDFAAGASSRPFGAEPSRRGRGLVVPVDTPPARSPGAGTSSRRRGLVVPVEPHTAPSRGERPRTDAARFTRAPMEASRVAAIARRTLKDADAGAAKLVRRLVVRPYGALVALLALGAVLLALGGLAVALHNASSGRGSAERREAATAAGLRGAQGRIRELRIERDRSAAAARAADSRKTAATAAATSWRTRAHRAERRLAQLRHARRRHR